ncbi:MAG: hypothetical protein WC508_05100 [Patescibacteria group bacterium]
MSNNIQFNELQKAILETVAFFDIFEYPLTLVEVYKWLYLTGSQKDKYKLINIIQALGGSDLQGYIETKNGFYFLRGRPKIIRTRLDRYQIAEGKFKIALKTIKQLQHLAFIKMIAVCNTVGYNNATPVSDIDFFIIVKNGRLWWSRLVITLITSLFGIRRHDQKIADRVCLSFYISDNHLNLSDIALKPDDIYLNYWLVTLAPVYGNSVYQDFLAANSWLVNQLPNFYAAGMTNRRFVSDNNLAKGLKKIDEFLLGDFIGGFFEYLAKAMELKKMKKRIAADGLVANTNVIVNDTMLKFHENDRRAEYQSLWRKALANFGFNR